MKYKCNYCGSTAKKKGVCKSCGAEVDDSEIIIVSGVTGTSGGWLQYCKDDDERYIRNERRYRLVFIIECILGLSLIIYLIIKNIDDEGLYANRQCRQCIRVADNETIDRIEGQLE